MIRDYDKRKFNVEAVTNYVTRWIETYFWQADNQRLNAIVGMSGGKDSTIAAALCARAIGSDRVLGLLLPDGDQPDIDDAIRACDAIGIRYMCFNMQRVTNDIIYGINNTIQDTEHNGKYVHFMKAVTDDCASKQTVMNLPPRLRLAILYAYAQTFNCRVCNTSNLSERYIGYTTYNGDNRGCFSPLYNLTVTEIKAIGHYLQLPYDLVEKDPADGLSGKTDEDNIGFTYEVLDRYILSGWTESMETTKKIYDLHHSNEFKSNPMPNCMIPESIAYDYC